MRRSTLFFVLGFAMIFGGIIALIASSLSSSSYGVAVAVFPIPFIFVAGRPEGMAYAAALAGMLFFVVVLIIYALMLYFVLRESRRAMAGPG